MKPKYTIIGLTGYAGSGKDTVRNILERRGFAGMAFADPIRAMLRELLTSNGIDDRFINERDFKETIIHELGVSYRQMAQTLGTEWGRALHADFWVRLASAYIADLVDGGCTAFVISDVRFANEARWVKDHGGQLWNIYRPDTTPVRAHISEQEFLHLSADRVIDNTGTLVDLELNVLDAMMGVSA